MLPVQKFKLAFLFKPHCSYWQISYIRAMKSRSDCVRADCVAKAQKEIAAYIRFKTLMEEWIDLGIESSKLRLKVDKKTASGQKRNRYSARILKGRGFRYPFVKY